MNTAGGRYQDVSEWQISRDWVAIIVVVRGSNRFIRSFIPMSGGCRYQIPTYDRQAQQLYCDWDYSMQLYALKGLQKNWIMSMGVPQHSFSFDRPLIGLIVIGTTYSILHAECSQELLAFWIKTGG